MSPRRSKASTEALAPSSSGSPERTGAPAVGHEENVLGLQIPVQDLPGIWLHLEDGGAIRLKMFNRARVLDYKLKVRERLCCCVRKWSCSAWQTLWIVKAVFA